MNKWVNPEPGIKTDNEFPPQNGIPYTFAIPFDTIKKQVRKKKVSRKLKKERIAIKSVSLAERLGNSKSDWTI